MDPSKDLYGSGNLRNRANGPTWWYMIFYSAGGFPFDDDMKPTLNTPAGQYAVDLYLQDKKVNHPEAANWGTPQQIPRIAQGHVVSLPVLGRHRQTQREPGEVEDHRQVAVRPGAGLGFLRQAPAPVDLFAACRDPDQQIQPAQSASRLPRALARLRQEQRPDRQRSGEHVQ